MNISKRVEQKVISFIAEKQLITKNDSVLVALSGGPDSVFLLSFLYKFKKKYSINIAALHVNHKLRKKDSDEDAMFCSSLCNSLNIPFYDVEKNVAAYAKQNKISIEEAGRINRYEELNRTARYHNYNKIATAHVINDNTETVIRNLVKGTGLKGISGIPVKRGKIIRPVLCLQKEEILSYLKTNKIQFRTDKSNLDNKYERNFIRNEIIPRIKQKLNPNVDESVLRSSLVFRNYLRFIEEQIDKLNKIIAIDDCSLSIRISDIKKNDPLIISELLISTAGTQFNVQLDYKDVQSILGLIEAEASKQIYLSEGLNVLRERDRLLFRVNNNSENIFKEKIVNLNQSVKVGISTIWIEEVKSRPDTFSSDGNTEYIDANELDDKFVVRQWKAGDKFIPFGMSGTKKISDYLNTLKIPASEKKLKLVLLNKEKIVWVIGSRIDNRFRITSETKKVIRLCLK